MPTTPTTPGTPGTSGTSGTPGTPATPATPGTPAGRPALEQVALFRDLSAVELARLEHLGRRRQYAPGETVVKQGDGGIAVFVILSGQARVVREGQDGQMRELRTLGPGGVFGEMALLSNHPRTATVVAVDTVECLALHRLDFLEELRRQPEVAIRLLETLSRRVEDAERRG